MTQGFPDFFERDGELVFDCFFGDFQFCGDFFMGEKLFPAKLVNAAAFGGQALHYGPDVFQYFLFFQVFGWRNRSGGGLKLMEEDVAAGRVSQRLQNLETDGGIKIGL